MNKKREYVRKMHQSNLSYNNTATHAIIEQSSLVAPFQIHSSISTTHL